MGQKTNPIGNRLGFIKGWESNWFGGKEFAVKLHEDERIRNYLFTRLAKASVSKIIIERKLDLITVTIHTARPGIIIGKGGQEVDKLKEELKKITKKEIQINIHEIRRPELDSRLVAATIARQMEGRISYKRAVKTAIASAIRMGAEGIKIRVGGRLGGAEIARSEEFKEGRIPLHTLRADIDFSRYEAHTTFGRIGIKVWICKGEVLGRRNLIPNLEAAGNKKKRNK
ncbi:MAG: 30S ribosomal protein S3 [Bacteroidetes bacterium]|nr:30S ribosomal protein S3 [Bacteroidota bacterium]